MADSGIRTALIGVKDAVLKAVLSPAGLNWTPHELTIVKRTWAGGVAGADGGSTDTVLVTLGQYFPVREVSQSEINGSGGRLLAGDIVVRAITPWNGTVGYTPQQLAPNGAQGVEIVYVIAGQTGPEAAPLSGEYGLYKLRMDKNLSYELTLSRARKSPTV